MTSGLETCNLYGRGCYFQTEAEVNMSMTDDCAYRRSLETVLNWIDKDVNTSKTQVVFRTYAPVHFRKLQGGRIKTTLYNDDIEAYEDVIQDKMVYEISNAKLKPVPEKYRTSPEDHPYQLSFNNSTIIQPVPEYIVLASIPRSITLDDRYDVVGIVIHVEQLRSVSSTAQPMVITTWADLAVKEGQALKDVAEPFRVVGFTSLRPSYHKGFSLANYQLHIFKFAPVGGKADALRAWRKANKETVAAKAQQVLKVRLPETQRRIITIKQLRQKKVATTLQDERHWLHFTIPDFDIKIMNITFEAVDDTGSYTFTAFTEDTEKLLEVKATNLYSMPQQVLPIFSFKGKLVQKTGFNIDNQLGPATTASSIIFWSSQSVRYLPF
ncbi:hypothetical protein RND81_07G163800 [Saponaria officinalis]|uniref:Trichome birefringence-like C-terminal domain-containing protein n=1 Tax=Saponaria officinalis TaxID=3572 RepID=A0AAW1JTD9_SAPOF